MSDLEKNIARIEKKLRSNGISLPDVMINRCLVDVALQDREGVARRVKETELREKLERLKGFQILNLENLIPYEIFMWSVGVGGFQMPKFFGYGWTIDEAMRNAESKLDERLEAVAQADRKKATKRVKRKVA